MTYSVGTLWGIYIVVLVVAWIILWLLVAASAPSTSMNYGTAFFLATIFGAVAAFIGAAWLDPNQLTDNDKTWLTVLFLVAFLLPVLIILYLFWFDSSFQPNCQPQCSACCKPNPCYITRTIQCNSETGQCELKKKTIHTSDGNQLKIKYT